MIFEKFNQLPSPPSLAPNPSYLFVSKLVGSYKLAISNSYVVLTNNWLELSWW